MKRKLFSLPRPTIYQYLFIIACMYLQNLAESIFELFKFISTVSIFLSFNILTSLETNFSFFFMLTIIPHFQNLWRTGAGAGAGHQFLTPELESQTFCDRGAGVTNILWPRSWSRKHFVNPEAGVANILWPRSWSRKHFVTPELESQTFFQNCFDPGAGVANIFWPRSWSCKHSVTPELESQTIFDPGAGVKAAKSGGVTVSTYFT